jgi:hypothetical protein
MKASALLTGKWSGPAPPSLPAVTDHNILRPLDGHLDDSPATSQLTQEHGLLVLELPWEPFRPLGSAAIRRLDHRAGFHERKSPSRTSPDCYGGIPGPRNASSNHRRAME